MYVVLFEVMVVTAHVLSVSWVHVYRCMFMGACSHGLFVVQRLELYNTEQAFSYGSTTSAEIGSGGGKPNSSAHSHNTGRPSEPHV